MIGAPPPLRVVALDSARQHLTAPARCAACDHPWQAVVPAPPPRDGLTCPQCGSQTDAVEYAKVHNALEVLDNLREKVRKGHIVAFVAAGIQDDDTCFMWASATGNVSRLRMQGAMAHAMHMYQHGEDIA